MSGHVPEGGKGKFAEFVHCFLTSDYSMQRFFSDFERVNFETDYIIDEVSRNGCRLRRLSLQMEEERTPAVMVVVVVIRQRERCLSVLLWTAHNPNILTWLYN